MHKANKVEMLTVYIGYVINKCLTLFNINDTTKTLRKSSKK